MEDSKIHMQKLDENIELDNNIDNEQSEKLHQSLQDLSEIQNHLSQLIVQQDESLDRIENNIISTSMTIEHANTELEIANKYHFNYIKYFKFI